MKKSVIIAIVILALYLPWCISANEQNWTPDLAPQVMESNFVINDQDYASFTIICSTGDTLSGEFKITNNGDLFIGDQTKYDNWLLDGIDFLIIDATNYDLWSNGLLVTPLYERKGVIELDWSVEIPSDGSWYIIYYNDSIFMKQIECEVHHTSPSGTITTMIKTALIIIPSLIILILYFRFRKKK